MKRFSLLGALLAIPALALMVTVSGCTKGENKGTPPQAKDGTAKDGTPKDGTAKDGEPKKGKAEELEAKTDGVIKGRVVVDGPKPEMPPEKNIQTAKGKDLEVCEAGSPSEKVEQTWIVSKDGGVANVVVWLAPPEGKSFKLTDEIKGEFKHDAVIDQPHCAFVPHILAMYPKGGQDELVVKNSAEIPHNTNITGDERKGNSNKNLNIGPKTEEKFKVNYQKEPLHVKCDRHPWMNAKIFTFNQPYFAVTDKDGNFEIKHVPTDVPLTVVMWHEAKGEVKGTDAHTFKSGSNDVSLKISTK